jgi:hypothetical protein
MTTDLHYCVAGAPPGLLAESRLRSTRGLRMPGREIGANRLSGRLAPDWSRAHWLRLPGGAWNWIIPAIFSPTVDDENQSAATTADPHTMSSFTMGGAGTLILGVFAYHSSTARTVSSAVFNGSEALSVARQQSNDVGDAYVTTLLYRHGATVTTASIVVDFSAAPTQSRLLAYWVTELVAAPPEATAGAFGDNATNATATTTTISANAFIAMVAGCFGGASDPTATSPTVKVIGSTNGGGNNAAVGYRIAGAAGSYGTQWNTADDTVQIAAAAFEVVAGSRSLPLVRRHSSLVCR